MSLIDKRAATGSVPGIQIPNALCLDKISPLFPPPRKQRGSIIRWAFKEEEEEEEEAPLRPVTDKHIEQL